MNSLFWRKQKESEESQGVEKRVKYEASRKGPHTSIASPEFHVSLHFDAALEPKLCPK